MKFQESSSAVLPAAGKHAKAWFRECNSCKQVAHTREDQYCYETIIQSLSYISDDFVTASSSEQYCCLVCLETLENCSPNVDAQHHHNEIHKKQRQQYAQALKPKLHPRVLEEGGRQNDHYSEDRPSTDAQHHDALGRKLQAEEEKRYQKCLRGLDATTDDDFIGFEFHEEFKLDEEEKRIHELYNAFAVAKSRGEPGDAEGAKLVEAAKLRWWYDAPQPALTVQQLRVQMLEIKEARYQEPCQRALADLTGVEFSHQKGEDENNRLSYCNAPQMSTTTSVSRGDELRVGEEDRYDQNSKLQNLVMFQEKDDQTRIRALYSAFESGDTDAIRLVVAPKLKWWINGPPCRQQFVKELLTRAVIPMDGALTPFHIRTVGDQIFVGGRRSSIAESSSSSWLHIWTLERSVAPATGQQVQLEEYWVDSAPIPEVYRRSSSSTTSKDSLRSLTLDSNSISEEGGVPCISSDSILLQLKRQEVSI